MNFDLFAAGFLAAIGALTASSITYLVTRLFENKEAQWLKRLKKSPKNLERISYLRRRQAKQLAIASGIAVFTAVSLGLLLSVLDRADKLPSDLWVMVLPTTVSSVLLGLSIRKRQRRHILASSGTLLLSLFLGLLLVNNYYRLYPTLYSVLGLESRVAVLASRQATTTVFSKAQLMKSSSLESNLYGPHFNTAGHINQVTIPGIVSKFKTRPGSMYVPAIASTQIDLPVIILMSGVPGAPADWLVGGGLQATMDGFAKNHHGITPLVFVVDETGSQLNDTECVDSPRGNVETYLTKDVPAYIKANFHVSSSPSQWAIGGLSLGGTCGLTEVTLHPDVYGYFMDFSGDSGPTLGSVQATTNTLFAGSKAAYDAHQPLLLFQKNKYPNSGGYFAIGKGDKRNLINDMKTLYQTSKNSGASTVMELVGGEHNFGVWQHSFKDALPWLSNQLGATICLTACQDGPAY